MTTFSEETVDLIKRIENTEQRLNTVINYLGENHSVVRAVNEELQNLVDLLAEQPDITSHYGE